MPLLGPKSNGPLYRPPMYRIKKDVKPYGGRLLSPEHEEEDRVGGRIRGAPYERWYARTELEKL